MATILENTHKILSTLGNILSDNTTTDNINSSEAKIASHSTLYSSIPGAVVSKYLVNYFKEYIRENKENFQGQYEF